MDVASLGFRTDLALLRLGGTTVDDRGDHLVVRTAHNPSFWWGNFLLLDGPPAADDVDRRFAQFAAEFPDARHIALGIDAPGGTVADLAPLAERDLITEAASVMTASDVRVPKSRNADAVCRPLDGDEDWAQSVRLGLRSNELDEDPGSHERFIRAKVATYRQLVGDGHGSWFGAFLDGRLVAQLGLFAAGPGLGRFQSVETDPDFRRQGLAGSLVHHASRWGLDQLGATTLVMVADPEYVAIRLYRSVGFEDTENALEASRQPVRSGAT